MSSNTSAFVVMAILGGAGPARAEVVIPPVCARNEVLDIVAEDIARRGIPAVIVPGDVGQIPTAVPSMTRCAVRLRETYYDTNRFGYAPQLRYSIVEFTVRAGRNGLFVDQIDPPRF